jgi:hypothetical protein
MQNQPMFRASSGERLHREHPEVHAVTPPIEDRFGVAVGSGPLLVGDLRKLTAQQTDWYASRSALVQGATQPGIVER